jgi:hypothetical protein
VWGRAGSLVCIYTGVRSKPNDAQGGEGGGGESRLHTYFIFTEHLPTFTWWGGKGQRSNAKRKAKKKQKQR